MNKLKILAFFLVSLTLICALPAVAYADEYPPFQEIAEDYGITWGNYYYIFEDTTTYHIVFSSNPINQYNGGALQNAGVNSLGARYYTVSKSNPYQKWTTVNVISGSYQLCYSSSGQPVSFANKSVVYSSNDINDRVTGEVVFLKRPSVARMKILTGALTTVNFSLLMSELIALLPLLIPTLICLISIRKGLQFCLKILIQS